MRELLVRSEDPVLFDMLRHLAEKVWHANGMHGSSSWCNVDIIRVRDGDGKPLIILGLNPMPAVLILTLGARVGGCRDPGNVSWRPPGLH